MPKGFSSVQIILEIGETWDLPKSQSPARAPASPIALRPPRPAAPPPPVAACPPPSVRSAVGRRRSSNADTNEVHYSRRVITQLQGPLPGRRSSDRTARGCAL